MNLVDIQLKVESTTVEVEGVLLRFMAIWDCLKIGWNHQNGGFSLGFPSKPNGLPKKTHTRASSTLLKGPLWVPFP